MTVFVAYQVRGKIYLQIGVQNASPVQTSERSFYNAEIIKAKQEWDFFINPETGRRIYNSLCLKCKNKCKQSHKTIVVFLPEVQIKRGAKSIKNRREYDDSG